MHRYFLEISFDGSAYHGWQVQTNANSVQGEVNKALSTILQQEIFVTGAGRTDTGVHAVQMFGHFDIDSEDLNAEKLIYQLNSFCPDDIAIRSIYKVDNKSNCRFDADSRTYHYKIVKCKEPFMKNRAWYFPHKLDFDLMNEACGLLKEQKHFSAFSKVGSDVKTDLCDIAHANWSTEGETILFEITADRFLRNMVRAIVGTMIEVGSGKMSLSEFKEVMESGDRSNAGFSVPAHGLYLETITYPYNLIPLKNV